MKIKKINELFDDPTMRDALEIPHIKGDLDMVDGNWREHKIIKKDDQLHLLNVVLLRYPILRSFHFIERNIGEIKIFSFFASTKESEINKQDDEYYCQLSIATNENGNYNVILLYRLLKELDPKDSIINEYELDDIEYVYDVINGYLKICEKYGVIDKKDIQKNITSLN